MKAPPGYIYGRGFSGTGDTPDEAIRDAVKNAMAEAVRLEPGQIYSSLPNRPFTFRVIEQIGGWDARDGVWYEASILVNSP